MKCNVSNAERVEMTRQLLKQFLYALHVSEDYGENRLLRVLVTWSEVYKKVKDPKNDENDEMLMIDRVLDKVIGPRYVKCIGRENLKDKKGKEIK